MVVAISKKEIVVRDASGKFQIIQNNPDLVFNRYYIPRTDKQNKLWWKVCISKYILLTLQELVGDEFIITPQYIHNRIIYNDAYEVWNKDWDIYTKNNGEEILVRNTSDLNTKQFSEMIERAIRCFGVNFGIHIELPDNLYYIECSTAHKPLIPMMLTRSP